MRKYVLYDNRETLLKWGKNVLLFTAPILAVFFGQLASGVDPRAAAAVAVFALYALLADTFKKIGNERNQ